MGFHVILLKGDNRIEHRYVNTFEKLADISELKKDSIIYEGEPHWIPVFAGQCEMYKQYTEAQLRAGIKAQHVFKKQAKEHKLALLDITKTRIVSWC